jgi:hypothetical protein
MQGIFCQHILFLALFFLPNRGADVVNTAIHGGEAAVNKSFYCSVYLHSIENLFTSLRSNQLIVIFP